jgi:hypothetical protein
MSRSSTAARSRATGWKIACMPCMWASSTAGPTTRSKTGCRRNGAPSRRDCFARSSATAVPRNRTWKTASASWNWRATPAGCFGTAGARGKVVAEAGVVELRMGSGRGQGTARNSGASVASRTTNGIRARSRRSSGNPLNLLSESVASAATINAQGANLSTGHPVWLCRQLWRKRSPARKFPLIP